MERTLRVLNELERAGVFSRYGIGGAMGATSYAEPVLTFDLDEQASVDAAYLQGVLSRHGLETRWALWTS